MEFRESYQPTLPTLEHMEPEVQSDREILEDMHMDDLVDFREFLLENYSDIENYILLVNDVIDGYGYVEPEEIDG